MKKFDVHVYIPVRFKVAGIEAVERDVQPPGRSIEYPFHDLDVSDDEDAEGCTPILCFVPVVED